MEAIVNYMWSVLCVSPESEPTNHTGKTYVSVHIEFRMTAVSM